MRIHVYSTQAYGSFLEAKEKNDYSTLTINGAYEDGVCNEIIDVVRAAVFTSKINRPAVVLADDEDKILNVFHESTVIPF